MVLLPLAPVFSLQDVPVPCQKMLAEPSTGTQCLSRPPFTVLEGPGALHLSVSPSPFVSVSPSLLSGFGLDPAMASGLAVLRMELLHPVGADGHPWPCLLGSFLIMPRTGLSGAHRPESRAGKGGVGVGGAHPHFTFL